MILENQAIIEAIKSGSERILLLIYEVHRNDFIKWASQNYNISSEEAKDHFQEAIIALYHNVKTGATETIETSLRTYLYSIGKNSILNNIRHKNYEDSFKKSNESQFHNPIEDVHDKEYLEQMVKKIFNLIGHPCKDILDMYYNKRFDMESIAKRMGYKNANVAKKKKYECIKEIEEKIKFNELN